METLRYKIDETKNEVNYFKLWGKKYTNQGKERFQI